MTAQCPRCGIVLLRSAVRGLNQSLALYMAALVLLAIMSSTTMMSVSTSGIEHSAYLLSGPAELTRRDMTGLAIVVALVTLVAPLLRLLGILYVLWCIRGGKPARHVSRVFAMTEWLRPWSMVEVFVFGIFVAYVKLGDLVHITLDPGVYALLGLTFVLIWADSSLDRVAVWGLLGRPSPTDGRSGSRVVVPAKPLSCETCGLISQALGQLADAIADLIAKR